MRAKIHALALLLENALFCSSGARASIHAPFNFKIRYPEKLFLWGEGEYTCSLVPKISMGRLGFLLFLLHSNIIEFDWGIKQKHFYHWIANILRHPIM